jgi:hypothetical protein
MCRIHGKSAEELSLDCARARSEQLECELKKCPDFQLYLITKATNDRARMERLLMENPGFRQWRLLKNYITIGDACLPRAVENRDTRHSARNLTSTLENVDAGTTDAPMKVPINR